MASMNPRGIVAFLWIVSLTILPVPLQANDTQPESGAAITAGDTSGATEGVEGVASYYAKRYNGRRTTSGARYNPELMTAAHHDLPLGTQVRVINLANDRQVVVTVNDRCRERKNPFIDLSRGAARKLGFLGKGIARVRIIPLEG